MSSLNLALEAPPVPPVLVALAAVAFVLHELEVEGAPKPDVPGLTRTALRHARDELETASLLELPLCLECFDEPVLNCAALCLITVRRTLEQDDAPELEGLPDLVEALTLEQVRHCTDALLDELNRVTAPAAPQVVLGQVRA